VTIGNQIELPYVLGVLQVRPTLQLHIVITSKFHIHFMAIGLVLELSHPISNRKSLRLTFQFLKLK
jgi:hypothetical protein